MDLKKELEAMRELCESHDWHYMYSDDFFAYSRGVGREDRIRFLGRKHPSLDRFAKDYAGYVSGNNAKPLVEDYLETEDGDC